MIAAAHRASIPVRFSSPNPRWAIVAAAVVGATVAVFLLLGHRSSAGSIPGKPEAQLALLPAHPSSGPSTRLLPPSLPKVTAVLIGPNRVRGAWDFTGQEFHGQGRQHLNAAIDADVLASVEAAWNSGEYPKAVALVMTWPELNDRRQILRLLLADWVDTRPVAAAEFAQGLCAGVERREMLEVVIREWCERDVAAAGAWLNALTPHSDQDGAVAAIATCSILVEQRPDVALSWAESIGAPTARWEAAATVAEAWARRDLTVAVRYFEKSSTLTIDERARLLTYVRQSTAIVK